ncbi:MAG: hypothetical protein ABR499_19810 [Gemmatimonadaceae bacterium]
MTRKFLIVTALVAGVAATAEAQLCAGTASFGAGSIRADAGAQFRDGANAFGGGLAWGQPDGLFLAGNVGRTSYDGVDETEMSYGINAGYQLQFTNVPSLHFCPSLGLQMRSGPNVGTAEESGMDWSIGGSVGGVMKNNGSMQFVPTAGFHYVSVRQESTVGTTTTEFKDRAGILSLGLGVIFNEAITVTPNLRMAIDYEDADPVYGVGLSWNFGGSKGVRQQGRPRKR